MAYQVKVSKGKKEKIEYLETLFKGAEHYVFADYRGVSVQEFTALRNKLYDVDARCHVVKNRLVRRVFNETNKEVLVKYTKGPTAVMFFSGDFSQTMKVLLKEAKNATFVLKGGFIAGSDCSKERLVSIARLPGRQQLLAQLMGAMNGATQKMASVLYILMQRIVVCLQAVADKKTKK